MTDERNFRSSYYEKVGFRSVEEKRSLEILLKERPFDKVKLKQFCLRFTVPTVHRHFLWKILFDVIPAYADSHEFIMNQRKTEFDDLRRALTVAKIIDVDTKPHSMFLAMWLLRTRRAKLDVANQLETPQHRAMSRIAETLWHIIDVESQNDKLVDIYWILTGLLDQVQRLRTDIAKLRESTSTILERDDPELYKHLENIRVLRILPYEAWFTSCFAGTISNGSIAKIWDKIAVGAHKILMFVAVILLTTFRRILLRCNDIDTVLNTLSNIPEETCEVIVNKAIESWQQNGSLTLQ